MYANIDLKKDRKIKENDYYKITFAAVFPVVLWLIHFSAAFLNLNLTSFGILPRTFTGLPGILLAPLIHDDFQHLISNSIPLFILGLGIFYFYPRASLRVFFFIYFLTDILVWLFARYAFHIGASGVVYGFVSFLFFSGVFRKDTRSVALSLLVTFLYGGMIWGIFPSGEKISWESHLAGLITGFVASVVFKKFDPPRKYDWEDEDENPDSGLPEISHDPDKNQF
ncbi:MAG: rhomboid family intramembrane serine protease [Ignavibacteriaceae bacterium]